MAVTSQSKMAAMCGQNYTILAHINRRTFCNTTFLPTTFPVRATASVIVLESTVVCYASAKGAAFTTKVKCEDQLASSFYVQFVFSLSFCTSMKIHDL